MEVQQNDFYDFRIGPKNQDLYYQRFDARGRHVKFVLRMLGLLQQNLPDGRVHAGRCLS